MKKSFFQLWRIIFLLILAILVIPTFVSADCADLERFTHWILETSHTVVFYEGKKALARVEIPNCEVNPLSTIRLLNRSVCDSDKILVDGVSCNIITVQILY